MRTFEEVAGFIRQNEVGRRAYVETPFGRRLMFYADLTATGRYLHLPHETPGKLLVPASIDPSGYSATSGLPHQHLLVSAAQAMGLADEVVGLSHMQGQDGDYIDCSGPLPDLI